MPREHEDWVRQLYLTHAPDLYRAARYRLQDPELAYDLTQEVFLTLLDKQAQVKPGGFGKPFSTSWGTPFPARRSGPNTRPGRPTRIGCLPRSPPPAAPWTRFFPDSCRNGTANC